MTDEERENKQIDAAYQAGYKAGLEAAHDGFVGIRRKKSAIDACEEYGRWLEAKLKEQP